jgi:hypothetical protein
MGFRFSGAHPHLQGLTLDLSKSGHLLDRGRPRCVVNLRGKKVTGTVGVPGTGMSYRQDLSSAGRAAGSSG